MLNKMEVPASRKVESSVQEIERELARKTESSDNKITDALRTLNDEEIERQKKQEAQKAASRAEYGIGWKAAEHVPRNAGRVAETEEQPAVEGLCCLVVDEESGALGVDTTIEPA